MNRKQAGGGIAALLLFLLPIIELSAHPHMFIDSRLELSFDKEGMTGFTVEWLFDRFFSAQIMLDYDRDKSGSFNQEEIREIEAGAFSNLINYHYFTTVAVGQERHQIQEVEQFTAFLDENRLGYRFFVPFSFQDFSPAAGDTELRISVFDDTFFCDIISTEERPVIINAPEALNVEWEICRNTDDPVIYDPTTGTTRRDNVTYSGTVFPEEIHIGISRQ